jgi:preprotein translocase subunit SecF
MSRRERKLLRQKGIKYEPDKTITSSEQKPEHQEHHRKKQNKFLNLYETHYHGLMLITFGLLIISLIIIGVHVATTGELFPRGVSLKGGVTLAVPMDTAVDVDDLQNYLRDTFPDASINVRTMSTGSSKTGFVIEASDVDSDALLASSRKHIGGFEDYSIETMGSSLGTAFFKQTLLAMLIAFVLMAIVVFVSFKTFVPSAAVVISAFSNIIMTIAVLIVFNIKVETAGIAALLMLIGYSVDTDILLTTRVLKREGGTVFDRCIGAMKTGLTMTITAIAAVLVAYFFTHSETLRQIMLILIIGLIFDMLNTWIQNVGMLRWYLESKSKKHAAQIIADFNDDGKKDKRDEDIEDAEDADFEYVEDAAEEADEVTEEKEASKHEHTHERKPAHNTESK